MKDILTTLNRKYDRVKEPRRFLIFMVLCLPIFFVGHFPQYFMEVILYTLILLATRIWWVHWGHQPNLTR